MLSRSKAWSFSCASLVGSVSCRSEVSQTDILLFGVFPPRKQVEAFSSASCRKSSFQRAAPTAPEPSSSPS